MTFTGFALEFIIIAIIVIAFLVILAQLFNLQVLSDKYQIMAQQNAFLRKTVYPARGRCSTRPSPISVFSASRIGMRLTPNNGKSLLTNYLN